jgi:hypothetical protein
MPPIEEIYPSSTPRWGIVLEAKKRDVIFSVMGDVDYTNDISSMGFRGLMSL